MGYDTYCYVERRTRDGAGRPGPWTFVPWPFHDEPTDPTNVQSPDDVSYSPELFVPGTDLNAVFFGEPFQKDRVRGLPPDLSEELRTSGLLFEELEGDLGPSWLTLEELVALEYPPLSEGEDFPTLILHQLHRLGPLPDVRLVFFWN
jgi:hypothetical protein